MPYEIEKRDGKFCVVGPSRTWCHDTRAAANEQRKALYANEGKKSFDDWYVYEHQLTKQEAEYTPLGGGSQEACANCQFFHSPDGCLIVMGDISPTGKSKFWTAQIEPAEYVQKVEIVKSEKSVRNKLQTWFDSLWGKGGADDTSAQPVGLRPVYVVDEPDGGKRAILVGSNNFWDRHDQIIPEVTHRQYIEWVRENPEFYPEFWIWHLGEKSRWGKSDLVIRADNFTIASGRVDPGFEVFAENLAADPNTGVSNGYYAILTEDKKEFVGWWPYEFTVMCAEDVANVWMNDQQVLIQGGYMPFSEGDKQLLRAKGVPDAFIEKLEGEISIRSAEVAAAGIGSKQVEPDPPPAPTPDPAPVPTPEPQISGQDLLSGIATLMDSKLAPLTQRLEAVEAGHKALQGQVGQTQDDIVTQQMLASVAAAAQNGHKPSESTTNVVEGMKGEQQRSMEWLGTQLDIIMKQNGVRQ